MKKLATTLFAILAIAPCAFASNQLRISQVYGGGGASTGSPTYNQDYVEIFNSGGTAVSLAGWTIEYGSSAGNWGSSSSNIFTFPAGASIAPCSYVLVAMTASSAGGTIPVTPDYSGTLAMSATAGKVALFSQVNSNVACGSETGLVDKVAFGGNTCAEGGTGTGALSTTSGAVRNGGGLTDTDVNGSDFTVTAAPVPHNSASAANSSCFATPSLKSTWGTIKTLYR
jgi:hypothetical protein